MAPSSVALRSAPRRRSDERTTGHQSCRRAGPWSTGVAGERGEHHWPVSVRIGRLASQPDRALDWLGPRLVTLAAGLGAALPVIVATVNAVRDRWEPGADQAIIATRAYDVLSAHSPLVGQYTLAGQVTGHVTHGLGPMLYWLLALPARFGSPASLTVTMGAVNALAIVGAVALARRRGDRSCCSPRPLRSP
jgi:hypothetical protein